MLGMPPRNDRCSVWQMTNNKKGKLIIISAPSGCGKTTIVGCLLQRNKNLIRSISYTTRPPRAGEVNGKDYFFISHDEFLEKKEKDFFLESAEVFGQYYGTSKDFVTDHINQGSNIVLAIDVQGMKQLKKKAGLNLPMKSIFIMPPSEDVLRKRLEHRNTETETEISKRLDVAREEMKAKSLYDFVVVNNEVEQAVKSIEEVIK